MKPPGETIQDALWELDLTAAALARDVGVDKTYVYHIVNGRRPASPKFLRAVAARLGLDANRLLVAEGHQRPPDSIAYALASIIEPDQRATLL